MSAPGRPKIVITGAEGVVGAVLRAGLAESFDLGALVRTPQSFPSVVCDVRDEAGLKEAFRGAQAVLHLAAATTLQLEWSELLQVNIGGTRNVFAAAVAAGVRTVVFASSGHVLGAAEQRAGPSLYELNDPRQFDETTPVEPDTPYGLSKVYGEMLARQFAEAGRVRTVTIRIGMVLPDDNPHTPQPGRGRSATMTPAERFPRVRAKWLSHRDCCQLFRRAIEAEAVRHAVVFGTSNNPRQIWDLRSARELLGYAPVDSAPVAEP